MTIDLRGTWYKFDRIVFKKRNARQCSNYKFIANSTVYTLKTSQKYSQGKTRDKKKACRMRLAKTMQWGWHWKKLWQWHWL